MDGEHPVEAGDHERLEDYAAGADELQLAAVGAGPLEAADEDAEPGGVQEVERFHVDHDASAFVDDLDERLAELRGGAQVKVAPQDEQRRPLAALDVDRERHQPVSRNTAMLRACTGAGSPAAGASPSLNASAVSRTRSHRAPVSGIRKSSGS